MKTYAVQWLPEADEDMDELLCYVARQSSAAQALRLTRRITREVNKGLRRSPLAYSPAPEWGEGIRRLPLLGQRILFKVDEEQRRVYVFSVMGGAENPQRDVC